jgi:hypothetical protein
MIKASDGNYGDGNGRSSTAFNRSVAEAAGELLTLAKQFGGEVTKMTFAEKDEAMTPENIRRAVQSAGRAHWDTSQLPHAIHWVIEFGASGAGAAGAWKFLQKGEIIERLRVLAGLQRITIKTPNLSLEVSGAETTEKVCEQFKELARNEDALRNNRKKPTDGDSVKRASSTSVVERTRSAGKPKSKRTATKASAAKRTKGKEA